MTALLTFLIEAFLGCHCARYEVIHGNLRCPVVVQRCELVDGFHLIAPSHPVCTRNCGVDYWPGERPGGVVGAR